MILCPFWVMSKDAEEPRGWEGGCLTLNVQIKLKCQTPVIKFILEGMCGACRFFRLDKNVLDLTVGACVLKPTPVDPAKLPRD